MKYPPFSKKIVDLLLKKEKITNSINLYIGCDAWRKGSVMHKSFPNFTMILPPYDSPLNYSWPVFNCDILIIDLGGCDEQYIQDLALQLFISHAASVRYISPSPFYLLTVFKKDF